MSYVYAYTDANEPAHRHDGGCTWAGCGPWPEHPDGFHAGLDPEPPDTLREMREPG